MTRKHYIELAAMMARNRPAATEMSGAYLLWLNIRDAMAGTLAADNPRFDHDRFVTACDA